MDVEKRWPRPDDDAQRVAALRALGVLDRPADEDLEAVVRVASYVCGTPMAAVNLIDEDRQWQAAAHGTERGEVSREDSMCGWSILQTGVTYTPDASQHPEFAANPFVTGRLGQVRLYASAPVITGGFVVGSLCAFGERPGRLSADQIDRLADLAGTTARILELRGTIDAIAHTAVTDPLTGMRNRAAFLEPLRRAVGLFGEGVGHPGVLFLDLNGFKPVNDRFGHHAGDAVLRVIAGRLGGCVRETELVARFGGDEFAVLVLAPDRGELAERMEAIAERITERLALPMALEDGTEVAVGASIGIALAQADDTAESLLARADAAMYAAKVPNREVGRGMGRDVGGGERVVEGAGR